MKFLAILGLFILCAGALAQDSEDDVEVESTTPEVELCPQALIDLYRASRNDCIDEIRANRTALRDQSSTVPSIDDTETEIDDEDVDDEDDAEHTGHVVDNRSRRSSDLRQRGSGRRSVRFSRRRKHFLVNFRRCLVNKIKDESIVVELKTTCVANCAGVSAEKREAKEEKCVLKKLKQRCTGIVPPRRVRTHRRHRHNNINRHQD